MHDAIDGYITPEQAIKLKVIKDHFEDLNESAGKKKSVRVSKAGCYIKPLLVQCANAVVTSKKHPEIRNRYLRLKKRRGHKKAIIAIARMLLTALYFHYTTFYLQLTELKRYFSKTIPIT